MKLLYSKSAVFVCTKEVVVIDVELVGDLFVLLVFIVQIVLNPVVLNVKIGLWSPLADLAIIAAFLSKPLLSFPCIAVLFVISLKINFLVLSTGLQKRLSLRA